MFDVDATGTIGVYVTAGLRGEDISGCDPSTVTRCFHTYNIGERTYNFK